MAHVSNNEFTLYTGLCETATECFHAYQHLTAQGLSVRVLNYGDPAQVPVVLSIVDNITLKVELALQKAP